MGGFGSGRPSYATTPTVEECRHLDSNTFSDVVDTPDIAYVDCSWDDDSIRAIVKFDDRGEHPDRATALRLTYTTCPGTDAEREHDYQVRFTYTDCNFGSVRPWFRCPDCDTRRGKLYLPPHGERFACRECHGLGYRSSRHSGNHLERAEQRYRKAFAKADKDGRRAHPAAGPSRPEKPPGMHYDTFEDLLADVRQRREEWDKASRARLWTIVGESFR